MKKSTKFKVAPDELDRRQGFVESTQKRLRDVKDELSRPVKNTARSSLFDSSEVPGLLPGCGLPLIFG